MGKFAGFITGIASGKVGGLVFAKVRGIDTVRAYQPTVNFRGTVGQLLTLAKNRVLMPWMRWAQQVAAIGFRNRPAGQTAFSMLLKLNNPGALTGETPETVAMAFPEIRVSQGSMGITPATSVVVDESDASAVISWDSAAIPLGGASSDRVNVLLLNPGKGDAVSAPLAEARSVGSCTTPIPAGWEEGDTVHAYVFFSSVVGSQVSDSTWSVQNVVS